MHGVILPLECYAISSKGVGMTSSHCDVNFAAWSKNPDCLNCLLQVVGLLACAVFQRDDSCRGLFVARSRSVLPGLSFWVDCASPSWVEIPRLYNQTGEVLTFG